MCSYVFVVPWMWLLNGKKSTTYAAAWTLVNAHELAIISGMAAAYKVVSWDSVGFSSWHSAKSMLSPSHQGAEYPEELEKDDFAMLCFRRRLWLDRRYSRMATEFAFLLLFSVYLLLSHATIYKKGKNRAA